MLAAFYKHCAPIGAWAHSLFPNLIDIIGNKREDLSFQRKLESRTKHPFEKLDSCLRRNDKQFISNSRYLGFG
jgi:hypothetical protein